MTDLMTAEQYKAAYPEDVEDSASEWALANLPEGYGFVPDGATLESTDLYASREDDENHPNFDGVEWEVHSNCPDYVDSDDFTMDVECTVPFIRRLPLIDRVVPVVTHPLAKRFANVGLGLLTLLLFRKAR